jgi:anti-sigma B factor antagonist
MKPPFEIRSSFTPDALIVSVTGEIDMGTAPRLAEAFDGASERTKLVVVDLTDVSFVDSSGLNALLQSQRALAERGSTLRIVAPTTSVVRRVFEIANLTDPLNVVDSRDDALS